MTYEPEVTICPVYGDQCAREIDTAHACDRDENGVHGSMTECFDEHLSLARNQVLETGVTTIAGITIDFRNPK